MRDDEPQREAVIGRERLAVGVRREERQVVLERLERDVRREVVLGPGDREVCARQRPRELRELAPVDALERGVEAAPARDAVDVLDVARARQRIELRPGELDLVLDLAVDAERPGREVGVRDAARVQHGPLDGHVLAGRQAAGVDPGLPDLPFLSAPEHGT